MNRPHEKSALLRKDIISPNPSYVDESSATSIVNGTDDDTVVRAVRRLTSTLQIIITLWGLTFFIVMIMSILSIYSIKVETIAAVIAISGSIAGIVIVIQVWFRLCGNLKLIPKERIHYIRSQGYRLSIVVGDFMEYDSLPLLRRVLFCSLAFGIFLFLLTISQVELVLWLSFGIIGMWHALIPVIIVFSVVLLYMYSVKSFSISTCVDSSLIFITMVMFAGKARGQSHISWLLVSLPVLIAQIQLSSRIIYCLWMYSLNRYILSISQQIASACYLLSIMIGIIAEVTICSDEIYATGLNLWNPINISPSILCKYLWLFAGMLFTTGVKLAIWNETELVLQTKGYINPQALSRTTAGWEAGDSLGNVTSSILLGTINIIPTTRLRIDSLILSDHPATMTTDSINII